MTTNTQVLTKYYRNQDDMNSKDIIGLFVNKYATQRN